LSFIRPHFFSGAGTFGTQNVCMKRIIVSTGFLLFLSFTILAQKSAVFNPAEGAIHGYDPVAYFKDSRSTKGDKKYSFTWNTATWYFTNEKNLDAFKADPEKYAPQYGGYCAYGTAAGHKAPTDPEAWSIVDGKLYLNYNKNVQVLWKQKQAENIRAADKNWPAIRDKE